MRNNDPANANLASSAAARNFDWTSVKRCIAGPDGRPARQRKTNQSGGATSVTHAGLIVTPDL
jgi:hypothetical protein